MAALHIRDSAVQSIQNVFNYTEREDFANQNINEINTRFEYLNEAFGRFTVNHQTLVASATDRGELDNVQEQRDLFERVEENYLVTRSRLENRLNAPDFQQLEDENNDNEDERDNRSPEHEQSLEENGQFRARNEIPPVHNSNEDATSITSLEQTPQSQQAHAQQAETSQFGQLVERMCMSMANKKENTWGKFDGDLAKWQGFHDAFKAAVHDDDLIAPTFKLQFLKSSLEGRAAKDFGEWPGGNENYNLAWQWLVEQNKQEYATSKSILNRLLNFTKMQQASPGALQRLSTITQNVRRQLQAMKFPVEHYDMVFVHIVHDRLDPATSRDWELHRQSENPTIDEITDFIRIRARALFNAQGDRRENNEQRKRTSNDRERNNSNKRARYASPNNNSAPQKKQENKKCNFCKEGHWMSQCKVFQALK